MMNKQEQLQLLFQKKYKILSTFADACGNTFLIFDALSHHFDDESWEQIKKDIWTYLKHTGVDDALVLRKITIEGRLLELKMHVLEPDGTEADFCGNGARAVGKFLYRTYDKVFNKFFLSSRKDKHALKMRCNECHVDMGTPLVDLKSKLFQWRGKLYHLRFVDCIEPHLITHDFFDFSLLESLGNAINDEWREHFHQGVNVNCFRIIGDTQLEVMTFERGLYKITAACGTGSTACCAGAIDQKLLPLLEKYRVNVIGGLLTINVEEGRFWLGGSVILK